MKYDKRETVLMIKDKLDGKLTLTYQEIANISGYHPKYILRLKKQIVDKTIQIEHGNINKRSAKAVPEEEEKKIVGLYKRSSASVKAFTKFYGKRSYSCIYNILKKNNLLKSQKKKI